MALRPTSTGPKSPSRDQRAAIITRYLKPDQTIHWAREMATFSILWKAYPSLPFWTHHELPFALNHMTWFQSVEGVAQLESDYLTFHYTPSDPSSTPQANETLDSAPQPAYDVGYTPPVARPRTVAEFLKT